MMMVCILAIVGGCAKDNQLICDDNQPLYDQADFPIGVAIALAPFDNNPTYRAVATQQFNRFTAENAFKAESLQPIQGLFQWEAADALVNFSAGTNKSIHGHTLIWHQQLPAWITTFEGDAEAWEQLFKTHIQTVINHFKGRVAAWDVVNEAFNEDGTLRNSIWRQKLGDGYIARAFVYAAEADPDALLFYNDFNLEFNITKRNSVLAHLDNLRKRGIKIDGIGLQMHVGIDYPEPSQIAEALRHVVSHSFRVHISELDVSVNLLGRAIEPTAALFERQADYLGKIVLHYKQIPKQYQYGITFWGVSDRDSWIPAYFGREDYPLLYDESYLPKPAYCKLVDVL